MPDQQPVLDQVNVVVADMAAAVAFYRRLGVDVPDTVDEWQAHHRTAATDGPLDLDLDSAAFAASWGGEATGARPGVVLGFRLASREAVDRAYADLTGAGHRGRRAPFDAFWGARYAVVEDPSGNAVGLMSPQDAGRRTTPAAPTRSPATADDAVGAAMDGAWGIQCRSSYAP